MSEIILNKRGYNVRVEYWAVRKEVEEKQAQGYRAKMIYEDLVASGRLKMSYSSFCDYLRGNGERLHGRKKNEPQAAAPKPSYKPTENREKPSTFVHDRNVDLKDLV